MTITTGTIRTGRLADRGARCMSCLTMTKAA
jgi:hypothetical protein